MATEARRAWIVAEQECFNYLLEKLESFEGVDGYKGEGPAVIAEESDANFWVFAINGAGTVSPIDVAQDARPACTWNMSGMLHGVFADREMAQEWAGRIMDALPLDQGELDSIVRFNYTAMPQLERSEITIKADDSTGGEKRIWLISFPVFVVFGNQVN